MSRFCSNIFYFNPTCDYAVANGKKSWQPNKLLQKMELDLAVLPMFFSHTADYILVDNLPSEQFLGSFKKINFPIPNFILKKDALTDKSFISLPKNKLMPWGWSPSAHKLLLPLKNSCSDDFKQSPVFNWLPEHRNLCSRKFALEILKKIIAVTDDSQILPKSFTPMVCKNRKDFETAFTKWGQIMVKAPWSSSGRGLQPIKKTPVHPKVWEKLSGIINEQGYAMAEPYLEKVIDIALEFEMKNGKVEFLGTSNFSTNEKGQYQGNYLSGMPDSLEEHILEFANSVTQKILGPLTIEIGKSDLSNFYEGYFGVDMLIYTDQNHNLKINPCLEINVRQNMGLLSLQLEKFIQPNKKGIFRTWFSPGTSFLQFKNNMEQKYPLRVSGGKIESGFFPLTEATGSSKFGSYLLV